uniref:Uncharacterized protein n=1 Tax=Meloidogyne enterolobii TaxID=390850 RepID=A0A6V7W6C0_MELEN|nr:unnamed protein product [Meloidogyne enterolobii]
MFVFKYHAGFSSELIIPDPLGKNWLPANVLAFVQKLKLMEKLLSFH